MDAITQGGASLLLAPWEEGPGEGGGSLPETRRGLPMEEKEMGALVEMEASPRAWVMPPPRPSLVWDSAR